MTIGTHFQNESIRKYTAIFATLLNEVYLSRTDGTNPKVQYFKVPVSYGPREKFLAMTKQKPDGKIQAIQLPRMSFQITGMTPDPTRKFSRNNKYHFGGVTINEGAPWNIDFQLSIMTKSDLDAQKIVEQILWYFQPDWTVEARLFPELEDRTWKIPIVFNDVSMEDIYDGDFTVRRALTWQMNFTMKAWLFGPIHEKKLIKRINITTGMNFQGEGSPISNIMIQPGLTANGQPTSDLSESIPYQEIEETDNWDFVEVVTDVYPEEG